MNIKKLKMLTIILLLFVLSSCNENKNQNVIPTAILLTPEEIMPSPTEALQPTKKSSMNNSSYNDDKPSIIDMPGPKELNIIYWQLLGNNDSMAGLVALFQKIHQDVTVNAKLYRNYDDYKNAAIESILYGTNIDLFFHEIYLEIFTEPEIYNNLVNIYDYFTTEYDFSYDNYFMNVFYAMEHENNLYAFPLSFRYDVVLMNNTISTDQYELFKSYETVNIHDLLNFYQNVKSDEKIYLSMNCDPYWAALNVMDSYIDYNTLSCYFDTYHFNDFLENIKTATMLNKILGYRYDHLYDASYALALNKECLFADSGRLFSYLNFLEYKPLPTFATGIPFTNLKGELIISPDKFFYMQNQSENTELAWEFIKFTMKPDAYEETEFDKYFLFDENVFWRKVGISLLLPTYKLLLEMSVSEGVKFCADKQFGHYRHWSSTKGKIESVDDIIEKVYYYGDMPMALRPSHPYGELIFPILQQYHDNEITVETATKEIQRIILEALTL